MKSLTKSFLDKLDQLLSSDKVRPDTKRMILGALSALGAIDEAFFSETELGRICGSKQKASYWLRKILLPNELNPDNLEAVRPVYVIHTKLGNDSWRITFQERYSIPTPIWMFCKEVRERIHRPILFENAVKEVKDVINEWREESLSRVSYSYLDLSSIFIINEDGIITVKNLSDLAKIVSESSIPRMLDDLAIPFMLKGDDNIHFLVKSSFVPRRIIDESGFEISFIESLTTGLNMTSIWFSIVYENTFDKLTTINEDVNLNNIRLGVYRFFSSSIALGLVIRDDFSFLVQKYLPSLIMDLSKRPRLRFSLLDELRKLLIIFDPYKTRLIPPSRMLVRRQPGLMILEAVEIELETPIRVVPPPETIREKKGPWSYIEHLRRSARVLKFPLEFLKKYPSAEREKEEYHPKREKLDYNQQSPDFSYT